MQSKTQMDHRAERREVLKGVIEWYDKTCLRLNRDGEPNLLIFKSNINIWYKALAIWPVLGPLLSIESN